MPTLEEEYKQYTGAQGVNDMYEAQKKSQLAGLESAYQQNLSNAQAARDAIPGQYQARANDLAVQYERQRRNLNQQANANGLNTGAGSQMQLALGGNYNRDYGGIRTAQQQAIDQADRGIRDLQAAYNSSVQQAVADNDFRRTQALLADYQQRYQQQLQTAQNLANYGDFSGYAGLPGYSQEQIGRMQSAWAASNPQLAYNTGAITADQYYAMTGKWPVGYSAPGGGGWGDYTPTTPTTEQPAGALDEYRNGVQLYNYGEPIGPVMPGSGDGANAATGSTAKATSKTPYQAQREAEALVGTGQGSRTMDGALRDITDRVKMEAAAQAATTMSQDDYYRWLVQNGLATQAEVDKAKNGG